MTSRPLAVFGLLSSLACTHPADLDDDAWMVWQRLRTRWWIRGGDGVLRTPEVCGARFKAAQAGTS